MLAYHFLVGCCMYVALNSAPSPLGALSLLSNTLRRGNERNGTALCPGHLVMDTRGICDVAKKFILKSSVFFFKNSNYQRDVIQLFLQMIQTRESHEVHSNIRGKRCNFQTASGLISKRSGNFPLVSHTVEICVADFSCHPTISVDVGEEHPACWWSIVAGVFSCFDLCMLYIFYNHFQLHVFFAS